MWNSDLARLNWSVSSRHRPVSLLSAKATKIHYHVWPLLGCRDPNSDLHTCVASIFHLNHLPSHPKYFFFLKIKKWIFTTVTTDCGVHEEARAQLCGGSRFSFHLYGLCRLNSNQSFEISSFIALSHLSHTLLPSILSNDTLIGLFVSFIFRFFLLLLCRNKAHLCWS